MSAVIRQGVDRLMKTSSSIQGFLELANSVDLSTLDNLILVCQFVGGCLTVDFLKSTHTAPWGLIAKQGLVFEHALQELRNGYIPMTPSESASKLIERASRCVE